MKNKKDKNLCVIQARMGSTRLPNKVLLKARGIPLLAYEIHRVKMAKKIDKIVVATTVKKEDGKIETLCKKLNIDCFRGSENDVLSRYEQCSSQYPEYGNIVRITGDCPLIDPNVIDQVITCFEKSGCDYASNVEMPTFPNGMDVEIFKKNVLIKADREAKLPSEREHVTLYIRKKDNIKKENISAPHDWSHFRLTVDNSEDFTVIKFLIEKTNAKALYLDYISILSKNPKIMLKNSHIARNQGLVKSLKEDMNALKAKKRAH